MELMIEKIIDILFDSKYPDNDNVEVINHYAINSIIITCLIILLDKYNFAEYKIIKYIRNILYL